MEYKDFVEQKEIDNATVERIARKIISNMTIPKFGIGSVPTEVAATVIGKSSEFVRDGIEKGWLPIGHAERTGKRCNVYISPKLLWEYTGYVWTGNETETK